ncbi:formyltransferase family protein [Campylobacter iguaniorum]|uniref:formyltransferase family protein n=1 Tax=Campylobacter iguaniorum TaxID=1244531 RepID=UPI0018D22A29|nr:formyltransferase family protein [Campylobacter iguaniorum]
MEKRENFLPKPDSSLEDIDKINFIRHFDNRQKFEIEFFGKNKILPNCEICQVSEHDLSGQNSVEFIKKIKPDVVFIFGTEMIREPLYSVLPKMTINLHLGLSPRYRGSATLFWPFYFLEPNWAGSTFHFITNKPDAGGIIHQTLPILEKGDTIHQVACKVVKQSSIEVRRIIDILNSRQNLRIYKQKTSGKNFLTRDFVPQHLRVIYNLFNDNIVDYFLEKKINPKNPNIITADIE